MPLWLIVVYIVFSAPTLFAAVKLYGKGKKHYANSTLSASISFTIILLAIWLFDLKVPNYIVVLGMIAVFANGFLGYYMAWFDKSKVFDRYLHAFSSFATALLTYCLIQNLFVTGGSKAFRTIFVFTLGMALGGVYELIEAAHDVRSNVKDQKGLKDTNMDLLCDLIGSLAAGAFACLFLL